MLKEVCLRIQSYWTYQAPPDTPMPVSPPSPLYTSSIRSLANDKKAPILVLGLLLIAGSIIYVWKSIRGQSELKKEGTIGTKINMDEITNPIALITAQAIDRGCYHNSANTKITLRSGEELLKKSAFFSHTRDVEVEKKYLKTVIEVVEEDCLEAAQKEVGKVAVLMFASPLEAGGGMSDHNKGQEEDLCRRSDIFGFMWDQAHFTASQSLYPLVSLEADQKDPKYSQLVRNGMIHVPDVTVFRSGLKSNYAFLEAPFEVGMLVSPALNRPTLVNNVYNLREDQQQLKKVLTTQLNVAFQQGYDTLILGAFGCGAFCNPPETIAKMYKEIINTHFDGAFKKIVFAILDDPIRGQHNPEGNLKPFQDCFFKALDEVL